MRKLYLRLHHWIAYCITKRVCPDSDLITLHWCFVRGDWKRTLSTSRRNLWRGEGLKWQAMTSALTGSGKAERLCWASNWEVKLIKKALYNEQEWKLSLDVSLLPEIFSCGLTGRVQMYVCVCNVCEFSVTERQEKDVRIIMANDTPPPPHTHTQ